jgi:tRNA-splicing ligase RtcB
VRLEGKIAIFGDHEENTLQQIRKAAEPDDVAQAVLCADGHLGYAVPIGGVVAYRDSISPSGVGFDIACGNKAVLTDAHAPDVRANIGRIMDDIWKTISFGIGRKNDEDVDHALFDDPAWTIPIAHTLKQKARNQLGTVGSGNHYVDILEDENERIWIGVHFGSRGFGHDCAKFFLEECGAKDGMDVDPAVIRADTSLGDDYITCMELAGRYAYAGRDWVCERVRRILGATSVYEVHNHHNFAWREEHNGQALWVVRKGATPAFPGQQGFVGGSMGDISVIIEGVENEDAKHSLYSTVHGAGRVMGRRKAAGKVKNVAKWRCQDYRKCDYMAAKGGHHKVEGGPTPKCPKCGHKLRLEQMESIVTPGLISRQMMDDWIKPMGVELRGAGTDESPHCYKRLPEVLAQHSDSIKILHTLKPLGVAMAGPDIVDPYKD